MHIPNLKIFLFSVALSGLFLACEQDAGEGGRSTLQGKVIWRDTYSSPVLGVEDSIIAEYPAIDERVYLIYGAEGIYDDDFRTDHSGNYEFKFLRKGDYAVYAYQKCDDCDEEHEPVMVEVTIDKSKGTTEAPTIFLINDTSN